MHRHTAILRALFCALMCLLLCWTSLAEPAVITANTKVYRKASTSSAYVKVTKGLQVEWIATKGSWALVERGGVQGYIKSKYVKLVTPPPVWDGTWASVTAATKAYQSASTSAKYVKVKKGLQVKLIAKSGKWALVENNGVQAYMLLSKLKIVAAVPTATPTPSPTPSPSPTPAPTPAPTPDADIMTSGKYTNEQKCYYYLTSVLGFNTAVASGIMANIRRESDFNPECGGSYYGLVQWSSSRKSALTSYCQKRGLSASSITGQLSFLYYELQTDYPKLLAQFKSMPNTAQGAYDAAYRFCYDYERPAKKESASVSRGELARDTYFPKYA